MNMTKKKKKKKHLTWQDALCPYAWKDGTANDMSSYLVSPLAYNESEKKNANMFL